MYISVEELQSYLGITFSESESATITQIIGGVETAVNAYIGVDTLVAQDTEELIDNRSLIRNEDGFSVYLKNKPVNSILQVNGEDYTGVAGTDYLLIRDRQVIFKKLENIDNFGFTKIKYNSGYQTIPDDIKTVCMFLASSIWLLKDFVGMTNYRLGDESISLGTRRFLIGDPVVTEILKKYKKIYIAY